MATSTSTSDAASGEGGRLSPDLKIWVLCLWTVLFVLYFQFTLDFRLTSESSMRWIHLIIPMMVVLTLGDLRLVRASPPVIYLGTAALSLLVAYSRFGLNFAGQRFLVAAMTYYVGCALSRRIPLDVMLRELRRFFTVYVILVAIQCIAFFAIYDRFNLYGIPSVNQGTFIDGGVNAQGNWIALTAPYFLGHGFWAISIAVFLLSLIYSSRSTFILWALATLLAVLMKSGRIKLRRVIIWIPVLVALGAGLVALLVSSGVPLFSRFSSCDTGGASDSCMGRILFDIGGVILIQRNLWGYGIGNVMPRLYDLWSGHPLAQVNHIHNLLLELTLDYGIISVAAYGFMVFSAIRIHWRTQRCPEFFFALLGAWFIGVLSGHNGLEVNFWFLCGLFFTYAGLEKPLHGIRREARGALSFAET